MNYEEKIKELSDRIEKLEKYENKRQLKRKIQFSLKVLKVIIVIVVIYIKYVQPYKEKIDYVDEKVNTVESFVKDKWEMIRKYNPF